MLYAAENKIAQMKRTERIAKAKAGMQSTAEVDKAAQEFEAVFLSQMLHHMFQGVDMDPLSKDNASKEIYQSMLVDEYAKIIARTGGIGVADHVKREMLKLQEVPHAGQPIDE